VLTLKFNYRGKAPASGTHDDQFIDSVVPELVKLATRPEDNTDERTACP